MIFKVTYQKNKQSAPIREKTLALYIDADNIRQVRSLLRQHTDYLVEYIEPLDDKSLAYEQKSPNFTLTEFDAS